MGLKKKEEKNIDRNWQPYTNLKNYTIGRNLGIELIYEANRQFFYYSLKLFACSLGGGGSLFLADQSVW